MKIFNFFIKDEFHSKRIFGLDLIRFIAITYVVLGHSKILIPEKYDIYIGKIILDGVSIFFVLSGFLIGRILLNQLENKQNKWKDLLSFWKKRWLRTLPIYLIVLTFLLVFTFYFKPKRIPDNFIDYYFFIQNFASPQPPFFSESWSLSIEEWFYLIIPIIFFALSKKNFTHSKIFFVINLIIFLVILYRFYLFKTTNIESFSDVDLNIMRQVIPRLDSIMFGVLGAYLSLKNNKIWIKFNSLKYLIISFIILYVLKQFNSNYDTFYYIVILPALRSLVILLAFPYLSNLKEIKFTFLSKVITTISLISYSIYLVNRTIVIDIFIKFGLHDNLTKKHQFESNWVVDYVLFWGITFILSLFLYRFIEKPFMALRKKSH